MKQILIALFVFTLAVTAGAVENGLYNCSSNNPEEPYNWQLEITDESLKFVEDGELDEIALKPTGVWREDSDLSDGWNTRFKVERDESSIVVTADNVSDDGELREVVTSTFSQIADTDNFIFSYVDVELDEEGNVIDTFTGDDSTCVKL